MSNLSDRGRSAILPDAISARTQPGCELSTSRNCFKLGLAFTQSLSTSWTCRNDLFSFASDAIDNRAALDEWPGHATSSSAACLNIPKQPRLSPTAACIAELQR